MKKKSTSLVDSNILFKRWTRSVYNFTDSGYIVLKLGLLLVTAMLCPKYNQRNPKLSMQTFSEWGLWHEQIMMSYSWIILNQCCYYYFQAIYSVHTFVCFLQA